MQLAIDYVISLALAGICGAVASLDFRPEPKNHTRTALGRSLLLSIPALMFGFPITTWFAFLKVIREGHGDFRMLYGAGWIVRMGESNRLYDYAFQKTIQDLRIGPEQIALPFNHLSFESLIFVPFTYLNYQKAWVAFLLLNLALLVCAIWLMHPQLTELNKVYPWASAALSFTYLPVTAALLQGQDSILMFLLLVGAWNALEVRPLKFPAGLFLTFCLFRFQIVVPIVLLLLVWKCRKVVAAFFATAVPVLIFSFSLVGTGGAKSYIHLLLAAANETGSFANGVNPSSMANFRGLCFGLHLPMLVVLLLSAGLIYLASRVEPSLELAIAVALLVSYHGLIHDMTILLIPALASLTRGQVRGWLLIAGPIVMVIAPGHFYLASIPVLAFTLAEIMARSRIRQPARFAMGC